MIIVASGRPLSPLFAAPGRRWMLSLLKAQARGTSRFDLAMAVKEQDEIPCAGEAPRSAAVYKTPPAHPAARARHISVRTPRARTVVIGKSCRHTIEVVTFDHMSRCAAKYVPRGKQRKPTTWHHARRVAC